MPSRATKIVATLGPSSNQPDILEKMIAAGVNVVRLNFSHGTAEDHIKLAGLVREAARRVAISTANSNPSATLEHRYSLALLPSSSSSSSSSSS